jgi:1-acyl-sn-glycerol-3-phosphate acyltransferase
MTPPPEGELLEWLGRPPGASLGSLERVCHAVARRLLRAIVHVEVEGDAPPAPAILAGGPHRHRRDALALWLALPAEPRVWAIALGPAVTPNPVIGSIVRRIGGILPFWRGAGDAFRVLDAARAVLDAGANVALMPEGGMHGSDVRLAEFRPGVVLLADATAAPVVPFALRWERVGRFDARVRVVFLPERRYALGASGHAAIREAAVLASALADEVERAWLSPGPGLATAPAPAAP